MAGTAQVVRAARWPALAGALWLGAPAAADDPAFRVRSDSAVTLNAAEGWAGEEDETVAVEADRPFRLRLETVEDAPVGPLVLEVRRNGGGWERAEAHDFPHPNREVDVDFAQSDVTGEAKDWQFLRGSLKSLAIAEGERRFLAARGGRQGLFALRALPWPPAADISVSATFRFPTDSGWVALLWGVKDLDHYHAARFSADGRLELIEVAAGKERLRAQAVTGIATGRWHEAEIEVDAGQIQVEVDGVRVFSGPTAPPPGETGVAIAPAARVDIAEIAFQGVSRTPSVSIVASPGYAQGKATSDLLKGVAAPFSPGIGVSLRESVPHAAPAGSHSEYEWPLVIRRYGDGPQVSEAGDLFEFRLASLSQPGVAVGPVAQVRLAVPDGHLGGTFVETPGRIGPWQASNGDLYFIMEPAETDNKFMMMKSSDGGRSWREADGANRPGTGDLEAVDSRLEGDRIQILHQVTRSVRYHTFRTSDHPTNPDSWEIRDEIAAHADAVAQMATLAPRADGSVVAVFLADRLHYAVRSPAGDWSASAEIDPGEATVNAGPQAVTGADGVVHLAYFSDDGRIWYRRLLPNNTLAPRVLLAEGAGTGRKVYGAVLPLAYDSRNDSVVIAYRLADGSLWERRVTGTAELTSPRRIATGPVVSDAVDSQQAGADLALSETGALAVYIDEEAGSIFSSREVGGRWFRPVQRIGEIDGAWVRGNIVTRPDGRQVYAFVYDAGSKGGTGMNRYAEILINDDLKPPRGADPRSAPDVDIRQVTDAQGIAG